MWVCSTVQTVFLHATVNAQELAFWPEFVVHIASHSETRRLTWKPSTSSDLTSQAHKVLPPPPAWPGIVDCAPLGFIRRRPPLPPFGCNMISALEPVVPSALAHQAEQQAQEWKVTPWAQTRSTKLTGPGKIAFNQSMGWLGPDDCNIGRDGFSFADVMEAQQASGWICPGDWQLLSPRVFPCV